MAVRDTLTLTYFNDNKGRNELTRLIFAIGKVDYVNEEVGAGEYMRRRDEGELPFDQIPTLHVSGKTLLGQSCAIARFAARLAKLYPEDPILAARADAVVDSWRDQLDLFYEVFFERVIIGGKLQMFPRRQEDRPLFMDNYLKIGFVPWLKQMDGQLQESRVCPPELCFADVAIFDLVRTIQGVLEAAVFSQLLNKHKEVQSLVAHIGQLPDVVDHLNRHPYNDIRQLVKAPGLSRRCCEGAVFPLLKLALGAWVSAKGCFQGLKSLTSISTRSHSQEARQSDQPCETDQPQAEQRHQDEVKSLDKSLSANMAAKSPSPSRRRLPPAASSK
eukprot:TRINITY_DN5491_c2_g1_i1.p1 TRINITY_DN5491_c2_g1~~TRINITY_DN5491_c2_g1_i1.p1  ORF type:complete len:375 (+),score=51.69 TRINITY_DN5491_c2_g1_i1:134-1126(+)